MKQNGLAPILVLVGVLIVAGAAVVLYIINPSSVFYIVDYRPQPIPTLSSNLESSSSAETTNWKTYTNADGKYSIKYPPSYSLEETDSIKTPEKFPAGKKQIAIKPSDQKSNFIIYVNYYLVPNLSQANEVMQQVSGCDKEKKQQISYAPEGKDFILGNQKAIMYEDSLCAQFTAANFYILHNDRTYSISVASTEKYKQHRTQVDQILSTFKFLP